MGWLGGLFGQNREPTDPLAKLDPKLRDFLERESPVKYGSPPAAAPQPRRDDKVTAAAAAAQQRAQSTPAATAAARGEEEEEGSRGQKLPARPPPSQFPDGRYADLWRTYRPLAEVEAEGKSDNDRLLDVVGAYKERRERIGRAALENCADEQADWRACMSGGDWASRMTMCRHEVRKFERCYAMQSVGAALFYLFSSLPLSLSTSIKVLWLIQTPDDGVLEIQRLLKALGYLSTYDRPPEEDEKIQMHADTLFHQMLEQEAASAKAKAEGRPVPAFAPIIPQQEQPPQQQQGAALRRDGDPVDVPHLSEEARKQWQKRLEKLPEEERYAEAASLKGELRAKAEVASQVTGLWEEQAEQRKARKEQGTATTVDWISDLFRRRS